MLRPRKSVFEMREYHPPLAGRHGLRLDFNENTDGCSPRVLKAVNSLTAEDLARYPEREPVERFAAVHLGIAPGQVLLTNGVDEAINLICQTYLDPGDDVVIVTPTFGMYEVLAEATGARVLDVQCEGEFRFPLAATLRAITHKTRLVAVASPNNPTGSVASREELLYLCDAAPEAAVLVDEAYFDFHGYSVLSDVASKPNLFVARTLSKAYGLAGLRIGILAGNTGQMKSLRRVSSPYNVNAVALLALPAALEDRQHIATYVAQVNQGRQRLSDALERFGLRYWPSHANFVLFHVGTKHRAFVDAMRQRGILVRDRSSDPGCEGCIRITIGTRPQTDRLLSVMEEVLTKLGLAKAGMA